MPKDPFFPDQPDEKDLLREALQDVAPLRSPDRVVHQRQKPAPVPAQRLADEAQVLADSLSDEVPIETGLEAGDEMVYLRDGLSRQVLRKLRRGQWVVQDAIDLHGLRSEPARELLVDFLNQAKRKGYRCVRVVHGKGYRSPNREPVLKRKMAHWLQQRNEVLAYCEAPPVDGGSGATVILLKPATKA
ncbi:MAG: Smr/MutS family protein [Burkholderiales bacterium]|jgi:DNA-nicking Smr family endonuclease